MAKENVTRRGFLKTVGVTTGTAVSVGEPAAALQNSELPVDRHGIIAALGDTLIPSDPGNPGYRDLESHRITDEVLKALPGVTDADLQLFDEGTKARFGGKTFLQLQEPRRAEYLHQIIDGTAVSNVKESATLRRVYRNTRRRVISLYYSNFPEHEWPRGSDGLPVLRPGDTHQITNPNTQEMVTGWDQVGFHGPLTWEEEERRRNRMKAIHWHEDWSPFDFSPEAPKKV